MRHAQEVNKQVMDQLSKSIPGCEQPAEDISHALVLAEFWMQATGLIMSVMAVPKNDKMTYGASFYRSIPEYKEAPTLALAICHAFLCSV